MDEKPGPPITDPMEQPAATPPRRHRLSPAEWAEWSDERLLDLRLSDLRGHCPIIARAVAAPSPDERQRRSR